jgi:large subunit ribosomal protein L3
MTRIFDERGVATATTLLQAGPCWVTQLRTSNRDGYQAVQLGFQESKKLGKSELGHLKSTPPLKVLREVWADSLDGLEVGMQVDLGFLKPGDKVNVNGQSDRWRHPGSIGSGTTPGRVVKGLRMAGRMGNERVTIKNLEILEVDTERNLVAVRGAVPGPRGSLLLIQQPRKRVDS